MNNALYSNNVRQIREMANCSQREFAEMLNISIGTIRNWEQGRRKPDGAAVALLKLLAANPSQTTEILSSKTYSEQEKINIVKSLNWDYYIDEKVIKIAINGNNKDEQKKLFARTFQYMHWQDVVRFWGLEICLVMYNPSVRKMIIPSLRSKYDFIYGTILGTDIPNAGFSAKDSRKLYNSILSLRRNSTQ